MKNYKKLLLAGFAVVPLTLSSWTSEEPNTQYQNIENQNSKSSNEIIGTTDVQNVIIVKTKTSKLDRTDYGLNPDKIVTTDRTLDPTITSFDEIVKVYQ
ncbi:hypothetical protein [Chryseobacterium sp. SIMBA_038]|uniref:hypothetical protein n=1 Tax=Chryseobacterium sp. SIMBA_038 TaxID=3085780 RepID=UPI00397C5497